MKCLVVSDSHGDRDILESILAHNQNQVDAFFHCGDSELEADDTLFNEFNAVIGNMDFDMNFPKELVKVVNDETIYVSHGHLTGVKTGLLTLKLKAQAKHAKFAFFGHTHELGCEMADGMLLLNPGSISLPRGKYRDLGGTYAIVETNKKVIHVSYFTRQHKMVPELTFEFKH
ncbi:metallophosphoesterase [Dellaglioa sp. BT-FLS60]